MNEAGRMSDEKRNEGQLVTDILGLESLVDEITYKLADEAGDAPTATAILGPFWRQDAPRRNMGKRVHATIHVIAQLTITLQVTRLFLGSKTAIIP